MPIASDWLNPLDKIIVRTALSKRETEVKLRDGKTLLLDYDARPGFVWFKLKDNFGAPCGWWSL